MLRRLIISLLFIDTLQISFRGSGGDDSTKFVKMFSKLFKNRYFDQIGYNLGKQINQNTGIISKLI